MKIYIDLKHECGMVATLNVTANKVKELVNADFHMAMDRGQHEAQLDAKLSLGWNDRTDMPTVEVRECTFYNCTPINTECVDITEDMSNYVDVLTAIGLMAKDGMDSVIGTDTFMAKMKKIREFYKKDEPEPTPEATTTEEDLQDKVDNKQRQNKEFDSEENKNK